MTTGPTILFIDDDRDFLAAQRAFFACRGYRVLTAEDPDEGLEAARAERPGIIFLDLMMEHVDSGFRLAYALRKEETLRDVPLVMVSAVAADTRRRFDVEAGGLASWSKLDLFLDKPVTGAQLLRVVEERVGAGRPA
jgi:CheY-like chemotaxis protein